MRFYKSGIVLSFLALSVQASTNGQLTQADLDNVQRSNKIIETAEQKADEIPVLDPGNLNPKLQKELKEMAEHARLLNGAIKRNAIEIYSAPQTEGETPKINFGALQNVIDDNQTQYRTVGQVPVQAEQDNFSFDPSSLTIDNFEGNQTQAQVPLVPGDNTVHENKYDDDEASSILWIFVSSSMPDHQIKEVLEIAAEWGGRVIYRGLRPQDRGLSDMMKGLWKLKTKLAKAQEEIREHAENPEKMVKINKAAIYMDPMAFDRFSIDQVPTMVYERKQPDGSKLIGKVKGLVSASYLQNETESVAAEPDYDGTEVFLGEMGTIFPIKERSFIEESKSRIAAIDWDRKQKEAIERHWHNRTFNELPPAGKDRVFDFDPSVVVTADVKATNGVVLAKKGEVINPLKPFKGHDIVPAHLTMFIFDATDEKEVEFVKYMATNKARGKVKLIATRIDKNRGFDHISDLNKKFTYNVTLLNKEIIDRFNVEVTPTRIMSTDAGMFKINEYSQQTVTKTNLEVADAKLSGFVNETEPTETNLLKERKND